MKTNYKIILWYILTVLFFTLIFKIANLPSAYGFYSTFLWSFILFVIGVGISGIIITTILRLILKKKFAFWALFCIISIVITIGLHIYFYFPPLKIIVPNNFTGDINLIVSPNKEKNLTINSNGIGYITKSIYENSQGDKKPNVYYQSGEKISQRKIIGYDSIFFFGHENLNGKKTLKFKIRPE